MDRSPRANCPPMSFLPAHISIKENKLTPVHLSLSLFKEPCFQAGKQRTACPPGWKWTQVVSPALWLRGSVAPWLTRGAGTLQCCSSWDFQVPFSLPAMLRVFFPSHGSPILKWYKQKSVFAKMQPVTNTGRSHPQPRGAE